MYNLKMALRKFFEENKTSFSYLFYAYTMGGAVTIYIKSSWESLFRIMIPFSFLTVIEVLGILIIAILPLLFVTGFFATFKAPKGEENSFKFINTFIVLVMLTAAVLIATH
jgi:hypothetical protein